MVHLVESIIDQMGGPDGVESRLGVTAGAVRVWKHRYTIPRSAWPDIIQAFPKITMKRLLEAEAQPKPERERRRAAQTEAAA